MSLYHVTPRHNVTSIQRAGILTRYAAKTPRRVWLCRREWLEWAIAHTQVRHGCIKVSVFVVNIPVRQLRREFHGLLSTTRDIPPARLKGLLAVEGAEI